MGVSSYLINKASLEEITISTDVDNLDIILAGQIPPNPIELISSNKQQNCLKTLRSKYDYIIIDTPPYGVLTDSFVLMKYADINIYVTRLGYVKTKLLQSSLDDIAAKSIKDLHILVNGEDAKSAGAHGKYYTVHKEEKRLFRSRSRKSKPKSSRNMGS